MCLLVSQLAFGQAVDDTAPAPKASSLPLVVGVINKYANVSPTLDGFCLLNGSTFLASDTRMIVSGFERCTKTYGGTKDYYTVLRAGKKFYIAESDLLVSDKEAAIVKQLEGTEKEAFAKEAMLASLLIRQQELQSILGAFKAHRKSGLTVVSSGIYDESEYTDGTSFSVEVFNPTDKVVKYVWFTLVGYNAVGDPVTDRVRGASSITVRGIGPIQKDDSGSYSWKYLWHTDLVQTYKLSKIKVQYMDGSVKQIANVKSITLDAAQRRTWEDNEE